LGEVFEEQDADEVDGCAVRRPAPPANGRRDPSRRCPPAGRGAGRRRRRR
jgi:hypothetical protein